MTTCINRIPAKSPEAALYFFLSSVTPQRLPVSRLRYGPQGLLLNPFAPLDKLFDTVALEGKWFWQTACKQIGSEQARASQMSSTQTALAHKSLKPFAPCARIRSQTDL